jgi:hypothetical protein
MEDAMANQQGGQWAQQQKAALKRQDQKATKNEARRVVEGGEADQRSQRQGHDTQRGKQGDERTAEKPIGEVVYADRDPAKKKTGEF